jgi:hypothetical protein
MRFHGKVGYGETVETSPGVHEEVITEREHFGDVVRSSLTSAQGEHLNKDLVTTNTVRIMADTYSRANRLNIRYVEWTGIRWVVSEVELDPERPRLLLRLGEVYNGPTPAAPVTP